MAQTGQWVRSVSASENIAAAGAWRKRSAVVGAGYGDADTVATPFGRRNGVEVHAAHNFLFQQFISEKFNHRTDEYGGSFENRMRLLMEVLRACQSEIPGTPVIMITANKQLQMGVEAMKAGALLAEGLLEARHGRRIDLVVRGASRRRVLDFLRAATDGG